MTSSRWLGLSALAAFGSVVLALVTQHVFDMQPCPWCVLQRVIFIVIGLACTLGWLWRSPLGRRVGAGLAFVLSLCGIAAALWQHFVASKSASCNLTLADRIVSGIGLDTWLPDVFAPRASCADAAVNLLGVPYDVWSLTLFALIAVAMLQALRGAAARRRY